MIWRGIFCGVLSVACPPVGLLVAGRKVEFIISSVVIVFIMALTKWMVLGAWATPLECSAAIVVLSVILIVVVVRSVFCEKRSLGYFAVVGIVVSACVLILVEGRFGYRGNLIQYSGPSMSPTLKDGDILVKGPVHELHQGDIVVIQPDESLLSRMWMYAPSFSLENAKTKLKNTLIKRIVAVEGDHVSVLVDRVSIHYATGEEREYECHWTRPPSEWDIGMGQVFVMGDNAAESIDSRFFGVIQLGLIQGKISRVLFPFWRARLVI